MIALRRFTTEGCVRVWRTYWVPRYVAPLAAVAAIGCGGYVATRPLPEAPPPAIAVAPWPQPLLIPPGAEVAFQPIPIGAPAPEALAYTAAGVAAGLGRPVVRVPAPPSWTLLPVFLAALALLRIWRRPRDQTNAAAGLMAGLALSLPVWLGVFWLL